MTTPQTQTRDVALATIHRLEPLVDAWQKRPEAVEIEQVTELIHAYGQVGRGPDAEALFTWLCEATPVTPQWLEEQPGLAEVRGASRYPSLLAKVQEETKLAERIWGPQHYPYVAKLPLTERLFGLSLVWSELKYGFPHFDKVPDLDWDQAYRDAIPEVTAAEDTLTYYRVLKRLVARLQEGHTHVAYPWDLVDQTRRRPAFLTELVENRVLVTELAEGAELPAEIRVGSEILAIDGVPVLQYAAEQVAPYFGASTPQSVRKSIFQMGVLEGPLDKPINLQVAAADGVRHAVQVRRGKDHAFPRPALSWRRIGEMGYIAINTFGDRLTEEAVAEAVAALKDSKGLIIDVRKNGGGNSGWWVVGHLAPEYYKTPWAVRAYRPVLRPWGWPRLTWYEEPAKLETSEQQPRYAGPVVVLAGAATASAAEDFLAAFKAAKRGPIFGQASSGATGQPLLKGLPGGGYVRFCVKRDRTPDGQPIVGRGIPADRTILPTVDDIRSGFDRPLQAALQHLAEAASL
ncbi:S41 family peptidase [Acanthopleuribacter pedis]|uniref:Tail specific protease domain-containing protein n=1 Tax=Acanthopleuribacter pedis TaxID=442870 RepID=A0A8J7Q728_9BACT|nr:S41 family peptidase [Acanthopleuribacter pedis]MBO1319456.1 hypothetical protein [Acanthopleuribacter pedis]